MQIRMAISAKNREAVKKMGKRTYGAEYGFQTRAVHTGNDVDAETGAIKRPITMANSYELPYDPSDLNWSSAGKNLYTRNGGSNQQYLQEKLASLEGGEDCIVLASGVAALSGLFFALLQSGDHVIFSSVTYIAVYRLLNELFNNKFQVETTIVDTSDLDAIRKAIRPNTKLIHIETPGNPTLTVSDIRAIAEIAHEHDILLSVDNTFASPYNQRPIELGADMVIHRGTKFLGGHNDTLAGFLCSADEEIAKKIRYIYKTVGSCLAPFDSYLILRGIKTLSVRLRAQQDNAMKIANWLKGHEKVKQVYYVGLEEHPGYGVNASQASGFGSMISFKVDSEATARKLLESVKLIAYAESLGGVESLITYPMLQTHGDLPVEIREKLGITEDFLRMSVGIENAEDLIKDLEQAFQ